jgi:hypothetical protein
MAERPEIQETLTLRLIPAIAAGLIAAYSSQYSTTGYCTDQSDS